MEVKPIPDRQAMYGRCGPDYGVRVMESGEVDLAYWGPETSGSRCDRCKELMKETGENHYCGKPVIVAYFEGEPGCY